MEYVTLGTSDLKVSRICLGTAFRSEPDRDSSGSIRGRRLAYSELRCDPAAVFKTPGLCVGKGTAWLQAAKERQRLFLEPSETNSDA